MFWRILNFILPFFARKPSRRTSQLMFEARCDDPAAEPGANNAPITYAYDRTNNHGDIIDSSSEEESENISLSNSFSGASSRNSR